jgi:PAS domain S-box-containing protein
MMPFVATFVQWLFWAYIDPFTWLVYYPTVFFVSLIGGLRAGLAATLLSTLLGYYCFIPPRWTFQYQNRSDLISAGMFTVMGFVFSIFHERWRLHNQKVARRESDEKFSAFITALPARAWVKDEQGRYVFANRSFEQDSRADKQDCLGLTDFELFPREVAERYSKSDHAVLSSGQPITFVEETESPAGTIRHWRSVKFALKVPGKRRCVGCIAIEITQARQAEEALRASEERYRLLAENTGDFVSLEDINGKHLYISPSYWRGTGWTPEEVEATDWRTRMHPEDLPQIEAGKAASRAGQTSTFEHRIRCRDGRWIWVEQHCKPILDAGGQLRQLLLWAHDITDRKRAQIELRAINRRLRMLSECNQVLLRATDEPDLLQAICAVAVEIGGYRMAWVGMAEHDEVKSVRPVAKAGFENGYLDTAGITWADAERGHGPTGKAIRTGQAVIVRMFSTDPTLGPWREAALRRGYAASAALPIKHEKSLLGALTVYSVEPDSFDLGEIELLTTLASNIAYGIAALRTRVQERQAREELHLLSARLFQVQDEERRHLARELHDTTAQHLAALILNLTNLGKLLSQTPEPAPTLCADCMHLARQSAQEIRTQSYLLHPPLLEVLGLTGAVEDYVQGFSARSGITVELKVLPDFGRLPEDMELVLFRIVQEGLANVFKHSRGRAASSPEARFDSAGA